MSNRYSSLAGDMQPQDTRINMDGPQARRASPFQEQRPSMQTEEREQKGPVENQSVLKLKTKIPHQIKIRKNFPRRVSTVSFLFCIHVNHTTSDMGQKPSIRLLRNAQGPPKKGPWGSLKKGLNGYDREMCDAWNGELDTLLTFTGLFSAAVTAFCANSIQTLSQSSADTTNTFLLAISQQLANSGAPAADLSMTNDFTPNPSDVKVNVLYFVSLILSLSVSTVCILAKQWIREFQRGLPVSSRDAVRVRQARFDALKAWKMPEIIACLPVLLLAALMLFFVGLLVQLWNVNDHTTAIAVSIIVALTALVIFVTTVVPAYQGMQPSRSSFTPFRSPQSLIFFVIHRRVQQWLDYAFDIWNEHPPQLRNWAEFDLHFLEMEAVSWFDHRISSIHRALRWVRQVLGSSSEMEQSLLWCLQPQYLPDNLIDSSTQLNSYVVIGAEAPHASMDLHFAYYGYSARTEGFHLIDAAAGRHQAEMLIRSAHHAIDNVENGDQEAWAGIIGALWRLLGYGIFQEYPNKEVIPDQRMFQDQVILLVNRIFSLPFPCWKHFSWSSIFRPLMEASRNSLSSSARQSMQDIISHKLPVQLRRRKSLSLLYDIGNSVKWDVTLFPEQSIQIFTVLDEVAVEIFRHPEGSGNEEDLRKWEKLREEMISSTRQDGSGVSVPQHLRLPDGYFDTLPGHGPLPVDKSMSKFSEKEG